MGCSETGPSSGGRLSASPFSRNEQVELDVQAIAQGMNMARAQAEAMARARAKARVP